MKMCRVPQLLKDNHQSGKSSPQKSQRSGLIPATLWRAMWWICKITHFARSVCVKTAEHASPAEKDMFVSACLDLVGNAVKMMSMNASRILAAMVLHALME